MLPVRRFLFINAFLDSKFYPNDLLRKIIDSLSIHRSTVYDKTFFFFSFGSKRVFDEDERRDAKEKRNIVETKRFPRELQCDDRNCSVPGNFCANSTNREITERSREGRGCSPSFLRSTRL